MRLSIFSTMSEAPWGGSEELWAGTAMAALSAGWQVQALLPHFKDQHPKRAALVKAGMALSSWSYDDLHKWNTAATSGANPSIVSPYRSLVYPQPDLLLISHGGLMDMVNAHGGMLSELWSSGVPYVIVIQANTEGYWPNDTQRHFMRNYFGNALQVVFVSRQNLEFARRQIADPLTNAIVWQQPVNLASRKEIKWPKEQTLNMASVARVDVLSKGQDMLVEILSTPLWRNRKWKLNLYGTGPSMALLQESAALGGISERVHFHGQVPDVSQIWRNNHILVMPSRLEGTPLAMLEALCCGRPAMVTDVGGSADWLIEGKTGFIAKAPRTEQIAQALEQMWQSRDALPAMGETAALFMEQSFHPRPGESLLRHLEAQLNLHPRSAALNKHRPLLSIVRVFGKGAVSPQALPVDASFATDTEVITVFAGSNDSPVQNQHSYTIHEPLENLAVAGNSGLLAARGQYVLLVENALEIPSAYLAAALTALRSERPPEFLCAQPATAANAVPTLGIFPRQAWCAVGGYPTISQADFQNWFWSRLCARGEKIEAVSNFTGAKHPRTTSNRPRVTVVVTCYNYARYLERCLDSVLAQDFNDFEVVIVNDGSTDTSALVADWIASLHPDKVRVLHQANSGQPAISRNNGISIARGDLILPLDADDWIAPSLLRECISVLDAEPTLSVAYADTLYCHEHGHAQIHATGDFSVNSLRDNNQLSCCSLYTKKMWATVGGYRTNVRGYEDWDFWLASAAAGFTGKRIAKPLFFYRAKGAGVFAETVANDKIRRAQIKLNNPRCYSAAERAQAEALLAQEHPLSAPKTLSVEENLSALRVEVSNRYQANNWSGCAESCQKALELDPNDCDILLVYADVLAKTGKGSAAVAAIDRAIELQPEVEEHKLMRANLSATLATASRSGLVSVVIPCYQQAAYLPEAVASVIAQTYLHWEIIIVNDGSPDDTSAVAQAIILGNPGHTIRLLEKQNGGLSDARNAGIRIATGEFILPLDADDKIHPEMLAKTVALLNQNPEIGIAYTDWLYFGAHHARRNAIEYDFKHLCSKENLFTCTSLYRKSTWEAVGGYNTNMTRGVEDWDFWIGCGALGIVGKRIPEPLFFYRAKDTSMIHTLQPHLPAMFARIILNHSKLYNAEAVKTAQQLFDSAKLPQPKPSSSGTEWRPPVKSLADFQQAITEVETLVRENRLVEASAKAEQALRVAPTDECRAQANEILQILRPTPAGQAENANVSTHADEFFGPDEVQSIEQLITTYSNNPGDQEVRGQLQSLQQGLMNFLVTAEIEKLEYLFKKSLGHVFRALIKCGLTAEPMTEEAEGQRAVLDEALASPADTKAPFDFRPLLARMLCVPAHRGSISITPEKVPTWLRDDYLGYVLHAPQIFVTEGEAEQYQTHLQAWAQLIAQLTRTEPNKPLTLQVANYFATKANYIPLYFSHRNTRELAENRASIMEFVLTKNGAKINFTPPIRPKNRKKIKVGFLSAHFGAQTETHVTLPSLQLDRTKFELCLFPVASNPGLIENHCRSFADSFTPLSKNLNDQVKTIRDAALDVLVIGTNVTAVTNQVSLLALHRLAPIQLVNYCSPVTTGMRHVDGYLSGTFNNFPGVQEHFSEKLQFCEGPPGCLDYSVENKTAATSFNRASLGLQEDDIVFINAAACFKILPEMQETWAKILKAVPKARLLLLPFNPNWSNAFPVKQFEHSLTEACARHGVERARFTLVNSLPSRADVKALEQVADVYLDTFPFSGSISVIDPLELGIPTVVWEGKTHRSRMASALLRELGITELITQDEAGYIALSIKLGTDAAFHRQMKNRIQTEMVRQPKFINPQTYAQGLGALIESLVASSNKGIKNQ